MAFGFAPTSTPHTHSQHEACSFCANLSHHANDCPAVGQLSDNFHEQVNATFTRVGNDLYSNYYNPGGRNHPLWEIQHHLKDCTIRHITGPPTKPSIHPPTTDPPTQ
jgi:hypothetical protein